MRVSARSDVLIELDYVDRYTSDAAGADTLLRPEAQRIEAALTPSQARVKRAVDVAGALTGLIVCAPLLAVLAVVVKLDSPGPVLFQQVRLGLLGEGFVMYKLRTMRHGAHRERDALEGMNESDDLRLFKIADDPRLTRFGRWMRRWSLDELPQLWNVLVGEMSLVGPRPNCEEDFPRYEPHHLRRLAVKPGLTGLWQVSGRNEIVSYEEVIRLDSEYVDTWSLALDFRIMARTLPAVINRRGAW